jgi:hypothetical protein
MSGPGWLGVRDALASCAESVSEDLAFRLVLRILCANFCEVPRELYERCLDLGRAFDYGEFLLTQLDFLVVA